MITIGIDPGWSTFGIAVNEDDELIATTSFRPKGAGSRTSFIEEDLGPWLIEAFERCDGYFKLHPVFYRIYIERFVAYSGVQSSASEDILMLIGALDHYFSSYYGAPVLVKAIDWKIKICQHLVKTKGFSNPGKNLDKKFSLLAAEALSGVKFKSDHEADAVCLSYLTDDILKVKGNGDKRQ